LSVADTTAENLSFQWDNSLRRGFSHWHSHQFNSWALLIPPLEIARSGGIAGSWSSSLTGTTVVSKGDARRYHRWTWLVPVRYPSSKRVLAMVLLVVLKAKLDGITSDEDDHLSEMTIFGNISLSLARMSFQFLIGEGYWYHP
jgi:hypothetical protein